MAKQILIKPVITEKSMLLASQSVFTFLVGKLVAKSQVKETVEKLFKVHVTKVTTSNIKGGGRRVGKLRRVVSSKPQKIARVTLKKGEKIDLFEIKDPPAGRQEK